MPWIDLVPGCSVWTVAHQVLQALMAAGEPRAGKLSFVAVDAGELGTDAADNSALRQ